MTEIDADAGDGVPESLARGGQGKPTTVTLGQSGTSGPCTSDDTAAPPRIRSAPDPRGVGPFELRANLRRSAPA